MIPWHSMSVEGVLEKLESGPKGLTAEEAEKRLARFGKNQLESPYKPSPIRLFLNQFKEYLILVLIFAAIVSIIAGESTNAYVILGIVFLVAVLGFVQEYKAERAMEALREMAAPEADALRNGTLSIIPAENLVPGDVIYLEAGDKVPADGRIINQTSLEIIESSLTGESLPVDKDPAPLPESTPLADRKNMVFMGTIVSYGHCLVTVTATGKDTELGKISGLIKQETEEPPLKMKLEHLAKRQAFLVLVISAMVFTLNVSRGEPILETMIAAIALAVAGVPEALPFVVTLTLAYGTQVMARKNAIIRSLPAVETLGSTTVICTDKTGTLTTGETTVREILTYRKAEVTGPGYDPVGSFLVDGKPIDPNQEDIITVLRIGVISNNASLEKVEGRWRVVGDPTEGALIVAAKKAGILDKVRDSCSKVAEYPFDSDRKRMTTVDGCGGDGLMAAMKGAPEVVIDRCSSIMTSEDIRPLTDQDRSEILAKADEMAKRALRVLALAWRHLDQDVPLERDRIESEMIFAGLTGMMDPPRKEAFEAIRICKEAGIRPVMITGDHKLTAGAIGRELGIAQCLGNQCRVLEGIEIEGMSDQQLLSQVDEVSIFARVTAEHKVRIVEALKKRGNIVAMTGDGVNDAPALKAADIGVAMGRSGTEVAKEASDMIITDDNFATIVSAVEEGRRIYDNIRKGASYLLSVSFAELLTIFIAVALGFPLPLLAAQILWINIVAEEIPAIGLAVEPIHPGIMRMKPRDPTEPLVSRSLMIYTLGIAVAIVGGTLGLYTMSLQMGQDLIYARTMAFVGLGFFTVYNAYNCRSLSESVFRMNPAGNIKLILGIGASMLAVLAVVYIPHLQYIFDTAPLEAETWVLIAAVSFLVILVAEILKRIIPDLGQTTAGD